MFCRSLFVLLYFFFWPLCCLLFFDIRILIAPWYLQTFLILNSSDCHPKQDPQINLEYPCSVCGKEVLDDHAAIHCDEYHCGYHRSCIHTVNNTYSILSKSNISKICAKCCLLNTTHSNMNDNSIIG